MATCILWGMDGQPSSGKIPVIVLLTDLRHPLHFQRTKKLAEYWGIPPDPSQHTPKLRAQGPKKPCCHLQVTVQVILGRTVLVGLSGRCSQQGLHANHPLYPCVPGQWKPPLPHGTSFLNPPPAPKGETDFRLNVFPGQITSTPAVFVIH